MTMKRSVYGVWGGTVVAAVLVAMSVLARPAAAGPKDLEAQIAALQTQVGSLQTQVITLQTQVAALQGGNAALQAKLVCLGEDSDAEDVYFDGCNVHVRNGAGSTQMVNGLGNLIVGYDEDGPVKAAFCSDGAYDNQSDCEDAGGTWGSSQKSGSHNLVVGYNNSYTQYGGMVVGSANTINGRFASVSGGALNTASGPHSSISGGNFNAASGANSSVSGGFQRSAIGADDWVAGGLSEDQ